MSQSNPAAQRAAHTEPQPVTITLQLAPEDAWAAAQFLKRAGFSDFRANAVDNDEAYAMQFAMQAFRSALNKEGFDPR